MSGQRATMRRRQNLFRWVVVTLTLVFFGLPLFSMLEFTTRDVTGERSGATWSALLDLDAIATRYPDLKAGFIASMGLAVLTVVIMLLLLVPTMTWVRLRLPGLSRTVEFLCLLPLTVPAIVLVVGLTPVYAWVTYFLGGKKDAIYQQRCKACHAAAPGTASPMGPNLAGVVGRKAGSGDFRYSPALKAANITWTRASLDKYLAGPTKMVPGTRMVVSIPDAEQRAELIQYLETTR